MTPEINTSSLIGWAVKNGLVKFPSDNPDLTARGTPRRYKTNPALAGLKSGTKEYRTAYSRDWRAKHGRKLRSP